MALSSLRTFPSSESIIIDHANERKRCERELGRGHLGERSSYCLPGCGRSLWHVLTCKFLSLCWEMSICVERAAVRIAEVFIDLAQ